MLISELTTTRAELIQGWCVPKMHHRLRLTVAGAVDFGGHNEVSAHS